MTAPFPPVLEAALKTNVQGGTFTMNSGPIVNPRFFCCISGNTVGIAKDPVAMVIPTATVICTNTAISIDYSQSWSPTSTINAVAVTWGDGQTSAPAWPGPGTVAHPLGGYVLPGTYTITLTMTDLLGATGVDTVEITVIDCTIAPGAPMAEMYCGCGSSGVWYTGDGGLTWNDTGGASLGQPLIYDVKANWFTIGLQEVELWTATEKGLYKGVGVGVDIMWELITTLALPTNNSRAVAICMSKIDQNEIYVLVTQIGLTQTWLFRTVDSGLTWTFIAISSEEWVALNTGADDDVLAVATYRQYVYIGGLFTNVDGGAANYIARWDTDTNIWSTMGNLNGAVWTIVIEPTLGTIYIGGAFTQDGAVVLNRVARWNNVAAWVALGVGTDGLVRTVALAPDGTLYAGGDFANAGGVAVDYCAQWNGLAWSPIGVAGNGPDLAPVHAIAVDSAGRVFVAGQFDNVGITPALNIAVFFATWQALDGGLQNDGRALVIDENDDVYVGGDFINVDGGNVAAWYIAKWVGTGSIGAWEVVGDGFNLAVYGLAIDPATGFLYAVGEFTQNQSATKTFNRTAIWNGQDWADDWIGMATGLSFRAEAVAINDDSIPFVGGGFTQTAEGDVLNYIGRWTAPILRLPTMGRTNLIDMDSGGYFIYIAALTGTAQEPIIIRILYDLTGQASIFNPLDGTWGGVVCDWYNTERVWTFGDFGNGDKVELSDDWGNTWTNVTDGAWAAGEVVRPLLISFYDSDDISVILNIARRAWHTGDAGTNWINIGATNLPAQCGARDWIEDTFILVGRETLGPVHLQWSNFLGQTWFERSTNITPNSPIVAISIVG